MGFSGGAGVVLAWLLQNGSDSSVFIEKVLKTAPPSKLFGRAPLEELKPEPGRSPCQTHHNIGPVWITWPKTLVLHF